MRDDWSEMDYYYYICLNEWIIIISKNIVFVWILVVLGHVRGTVHIHSFVPVLQWFFLFFFGKVFLQVLFFHSENIVFSCGGDVFVAKIEYFVIKFVIFLLLEFFEIFVDSCSKGEKLCEQCLYLLGIKLVFLFFLNLLVRLFLFLLLRLVFTIRFLLPSVVRIHIVDILESLFLFNTFPQIVNNSLFFVVLETLQPCISILSLLTE